MAVNGSSKDFVTFVGGLNTEAGFLTTPDNVWKSGDNLTPTIEGSLERRLGIDLEVDHSNNGAAYFRSNLDAVAFSLHRWEAVAGDGDRVFYVMQVGEMLRVYDAVGNTGISSALIDTVDMTPFYVGSGTIDEDHIQVSNVNGELLVVSRRCDPFLLSFDGTSISATRITIQHRDFDGVDDGQAVDENKVYDPLNITVEDQKHVYNLHNQGWKPDTLGQYYTTGFYPSNSQTWWFAKSSADDFDPELLDKLDFGTSRAPSGRFILDTFNRVYKYVNVDGIDIVVATESEDTRPATCAFFAGRAWYAGFKSKDIGAWVMFSQVATDNTKLGRCFQAADPTAEIVSELVDSDGGVIPIQEAGEILKLEPLYDGILVFATNGVWFIYGTQDGFSATRYQVVKVSAFGAVGARSVVSVENQVLYWANGGIYSVQAQQSGAVVATPVTDVTIKTLYDEIPAAAKRQASGTYSDENKRVVWTYSSTSAEPSLHDTSLYLDLRLRAFYTHTFNSSTDCWIVDTVAINGSGSEEIEYEVIDTAGDMVTDGSGNTVTVVRRNLASADNRIKFYILYPNGSTHTGSLGDLYNDRTDGTRYRDYYTVDGVGGDVIPFVDIGYLTEPNGPARKATALYFVTYMKGTEFGVDLDGPINESSIKMQTKWDFTDSTGTGKWSKEQQLYRNSRLFLGSDPTDHDDGYALKISKSKVRGRGRALQIHLEGDVDKDFKLVGWSILFVGNQHV